MNASNSNLEHAVAQHGERAVATDGTRTDAHREQLRREADRRWHMARVDAARRGHGTERQQHVRSLLDAAMAALDADDPRGAEERLRAMEQAATAGVPTGRFVE